MQNRPISTKEKIKAIIDIYGKKIPDTLPPELDRLFIQNNRRTEFSFFSKSKSITEAAHLIFSTLFEVKLMNEENVARIIDLDKDNVFIIKTWAIIKLMKKKKLEFNHFRLKIILDCRKQEQDKFYFVLRNLEAYESTLISDNDFATMMGNIKEGKSFRIGLENVVSLRIYLNNLKSKHDCSYDNTTRIAEKISGTARMIALAHRDKESAIEYIITALTHPFFHKQTLIAGCMFVPSCSEALEILGKAKKEIEAYEIYDNRSLVSGKSA